MKRMKRWPGIVVSVIAILFSISFVSAISSCQALNSGGVYTLTQDIQDTDPYSVCFPITASSVTLDCNGFRIWRNWAPGFPVELITSTASNTIIENCVLHGGATSGSQDQAIEFNGASNSIIRNNVISYSKGIRISNSPNSFIENNVVNKTQYDGSSVPIWIDGGSDGTTVRNNILHNNVRGILVSSNSNVIQDNMVTTSGDYGLTVGGNNNMISGGEINFSGIGISLRSGSGHTFTNMIVQKNQRADVSMMSPYGGETDPAACNAQFTNIDVSGPNPLGFFNTQQNLNGNIFSDLILCGSGTDGSTLTNVVVDGDSTFRNNGLELHWGNNVVVDGLQSVHNYHGVAIASSSGSVVKNSNLARSGRMGVRLSNATGAQIVNNNMSSSVRYGAYLYISGGNTVADNHIDFNYYDGVHMENTAPKNNNIIRNNSISYSGDDGIYSSGSNHIITDNNITGSADYGVYFVGSNDNNVVNDNLVCDSGVAYLDVRCPAAGTTQSFNNNVCDDVSAACGTCAFNCAVGGPPPVCGDMNIEFPEVCECGIDGVCGNADDDMAGASCVSLGFDFGNLTCAQPTCSQNTSECGFIIPPVCGNGIIETPGEECDDGNNATGDGCDSSCQEEPGWNCENEPSICTPGYCGDGEIDPFLGEECEGSNFGIYDGTCSNYNPIYTGGNLGCNSCIIDISNCTSGSPLCGNLIVEGSEECDDGCLANTPYVCEPEDDGDGCSSTCLSELSGDFCTDYAPWEYPGCGPGCEVTYCGDYNLMDPNNYNGYSGDIRPEACSSDCADAYLNDRTLFGVDEGLCAWDNAIGECYFDYFGCKIISNFSECGPDNFRNVTYWSVNATGGFDPNCLPTCENPIGNYCYSKAPCAQVVKLPFFGFGNLIAVVVILVLAYWFWIKKRGKGRRKRK
jgi:cysteine-rich repeat protein/parallel beta-helix repeat protein